MKSPETLGGIGGVGDPQGAATVRCGGRERGRPHRAAEDRQRRRTAPDVDLHGHATAAAVEPDHLPGGPARPTRHCASVTSARGSRPTRTVSAPRCGGRSGRCVPSPRFATQTAPAPTATALGPSPTWMRRQRRARARVEPDDARGGVARDPDRAGPGGQRRRPRLDRDRRAGRAAARVDPHHAWRRPRRRPRGDRRSPRRARPRRCRRRCAAPPCSTPATIWATLRP